ncbi:MULTISPECIES: protein adenylyltransferase SelO [Cupriavidus]|uniref:Protein nucleotidyltransferase YdiU n=1 Tax=Cupriavidus pinatubonensis (strain JMP 134 / LMG 1197) TaxID=264198 RepID=SELO_CUPPJ|nr:MULTISPECIES: YdiU family protein [Cupriavidus]Q472B7.1 RecName: Full=Protein adenylyltransferase SelO [Cupriavidus pinatubonensis JMP134]QYY32962.1 YdiU family protein [Cupriavidus pinatubonensis]TPQ42849.1 YdiU family protein [Cupriavidus pinatubonensis]
MSDTHPSQTTPRDAADSVATLSAPFPTMPGFAELGERFFTRLRPTPLPSAYLVSVAPNAAALLGMPVEAASEPDFIEAFVGNSVPDWADPLATVYSGHQFGVWAGQLGDGRAIRLAQAQTDTGPWEIQLKGAGLTPYSRMADGRAVLRSSIREYLCSEAMAALGVPTTRALSIIGSDAPVRRETIETAAVVTRLAPTFIRFGHFEHFAAHEDVAALRQLADFVINNFMPACREAAQPYQALLREVSLRTADMVAHWQAIGFCHGVMNTDNMSILGLTIDYGPFGFLDAFDANHICNHSDTQGRYAYSQQPQVAFWNLHCLAQALLPLWLEPGADEAARDGAVAQAREALDPFRDRYASEFFRHYRAKLGIHMPAGGDKEDEPLLTSLFQLLHEQHVDYTLFWRNLARISSADGSGDAPVRDLFLDRAAWDTWAESYRNRLRAEQSDDAARRVAMLAVNPKYVLRNHLAEIAIRRAREKDFSEVDRLLAVLSRPFDEQPEAEAYAALPPDWAGGLEVSCSS